MIQSTLAATALRDLIRSTATDYDSMALAFDALIEESGGSAKKAIEMAVSTGLASEEPIDYEYSKTVDPQDGRYFSFDGLVFQDGSVYVLGFGGFSDSIEAAKAQLEEGEF